jgi:hypothetical protein
MHETYYIRNIYKSSLDKPECKRQLGKPRRRWKDYIRMKLVEIGREGVT